MTENAKTAVEILMKSEHVERCVDVLRRRFWWAFTRTVIWELTIQHRADVALWEIRTMADDAMERVDEILGFRPSPELLSEYTELKKNMERFV